MSEFVHLNGHIVDVSSAGVSVLDRGLLYGDGLFETLRTYGGQPFKLREHLERMAASAAALRIAPAPTLDEVRVAVEELMRRNSLAEVTIRVTLTRGVGGTGLGMTGEFRTTLIIQAKPVVPYRAELYQTGMKVAVASIRRSVTSPLPRHKTANYLECVLAKQEAADRGCDEALFLNARGEVAEGAVSNVFWVEGERVVTPSIESNILPGITRQTVLDICLADGIGAVEGLYGLERLRNADEVFLTNSLMEVMPVRSVDGTTLGAGAPGPMTRRIAQAYRRLTAST